MFDVIISSTYNGIYEKNKKFIEEFSILTIVIVAIGLSTIFALAQGLEFTYTPTKGGESSPPAEPAPISPPDENNNDGDDENGGGQISNPQDDNGGSGGSNNSGGSGGSSRSRTNDRTDSDRSDLNGGDLSDEGDENLSPEQKTEKTVLKRVVSILEELKLIVKKLNKLIRNQR